MTLDRVPEPVWDFRSIAPFIPTHGWIHDYLSYATQCTDAPPVYHIMATLAGMALAIAPEHLLLVHGEEHPLHLFLLVVGESGNRKSAAIKRMIRVIQPRLDGVGIGHRIWYPEASTAEGIFDGLIEDPNRIMVASEWTDLHNQGKASYNQHTGEFMNLLYDGSPLHRIKKGGKDAEKAKQLTINRPCVSILGASTPSLIKANTSYNDWLAGKLARYIIGYEHKPEEVEMIAAVEHPKLVAELQMNYDRMLSASLTKAFVLSQEAWDYKIAWEHGTEWRQFRRSLPEHLEASALRIGEHAYRVATLYQASMDYPHNHVVGALAMERALNFLDLCCQGLREKFSILPSHEPNPSERVLQALKMHGDGGATRRDVMRQTKLNGLQFEGAIKALGEREQVVSRKVGGQTYFAFQETL